ncbi:MAG: threonine/serine exporter family protein [Clostridia bacterium]|nr:threonine/serine exporter family protein [Clostridia bacterium]
MGDNVLLQLAASMVISAGFSMIYSIKLSRLPFVAAGGGLTLLIHLILINISGSQYASLVPAAGFAVFYAELMAIMLKAPAVVFLVPSIMPLLPGRKLYKAMHSLVTGNVPVFIDYGIQTLKIAVGIAAGILVSEALVYFIRSLNKKAQTGR